MDIIDNASDRQSVEVGRHPGVGENFHRFRQDLFVGIASGDVLAVGQHHAPDRDLVHLADGLADDREGVVADFPVRHQVVGTDQIPRIDLAAVDELVDLDGSCRFQRDVLELSFVTSMKVSVSTL